MTAFGASNVLVRGPSRRGLALAIAAGVPAGLAGLCELSELFVALCDQWPIGEIPAFEQRRAA